MHRLTGLSTAAIAAALLSSTGSAQPTPEAPLSVEGALTPEDTQDADQRRYDEHRVQLEGGRRYRVSAEAGDFDVVIQLYQAGIADPVAQDDDGGEGLNSRLTFIPEASGEYTLRVLGFSSESAGAYGARVEALPPLAPPNSEPAMGIAGTRWHIWEGELTTSDPDRDGAYFDDYLVPMRAGETRLISVESPDFDAIVWVLRADSREGEPLDIDDDAGPWLNAMLGYAAENDGDHVVRVTTYGSGNTGSYRLRISEPLTPPPLAPKDVTSGAPGD